MPADEMGGDWAECIKCFLRVSKPLFLSIYPHHCCIKYFVAIFRWKMWKYLNPVYISATQARSEDSIRIYFQFMAFCMFWYHNSSNTFTYVIQNCAWRSFPKLFTLFTVSPLLNFYRLQFIQYGRINSLSVVFPISCLCWKFKQINDG